VAHLFDFDSFFSDIQQTNESLVAAVAHAVDLTKQLQDCNTKASIAELRARAVVEGGDAIAHLVQGLKETVITVERGFNESKAAAMRDASDCSVALHAARTRGILTVFLTYIGPCTLAPVAMFVVILCSRGSVPPSRTWMFVSKALLLTAYTSWVIPHVIHSSLSVASSTGSSGLPLSWTETLNENVYSRVYPLLLSYLPRSPAQHFVIGSCAFSLALAVQGYLSCRASIMFVTSNVTRIRLHCR
jgi:hypothetical protein